MIVFHVSILGELGALFERGKAHQSPPWRRDWSDHWKRFCESTSGPYDLCGIV